MRVFIVHAHPEPKSFCTAMKSAIPLPFPSLANYDDDQSRRDGEGDPHASGNGFGRRRSNIARRRSEGEDCAHDGCAGNEPEIARQVKHAGNGTTLLRADTSHHCRVVGRLEERVAGGNDDDGCEVAGDAEASVNSEIPINSSLLRPKMSPSRPALTIRVVMASR